MSNIQTAIQSIEAEISHVKSGLAFYVSRVESLEKTLAELRALGGASESKPVTVPPKEEKQPVSKVSKAPKGKKTKASKVKGKSAGKENVEGELPSTGGDYWPNLISEQPKHASDIFQAAVGQMGFAPTKEQIQKLKQRMTFALNAMVKAGGIKDQGKGRDRQFFKNAA